jgi:hypothetical protein
VAPALHSLQTLWLFVSRAISESILTEVGKAGASNALFILFAGISLFLRGFYNNFYESLASDSHGFAYLQKSCVA